MSLPPTRQTAASVPAAYQNSAWVPVPAAVVPGLESNSQKGRRFPALLSRLLRRSWTWALGSAVLLGIVGFVAGYWRSAYTAESTLTLTPPLLRYSPPEARASPGGSEWYYNSLVDSLRADDFLGHLVALSTNAIDLGSLRAQSKLILEPAQGRLRIGVAASRRRAAASMANLYAEQAADLAQTRWRLAMQDIRQLCEQQVATVDSEIKKSRQQLLRLQRTNDIFNLSAESAECARQRFEVDAKVQMLQTEARALEVRLQNLEREGQEQTPALVAAQEALRQALTQYTEEHPRVKALRAAVARLSTRVQGLPTGPEQDSKANAAMAGGALFVEVGSLRAQKLAKEEEVAGLKALSLRLRERLLALSENRSAFENSEALYQGLLQRRLTFVNQWQDALFQENQSAALNRIQSMARVDAVSGAQKWKGGCITGGVAGFSAVVCVLIAFWPAVRRDRKIRSAVDLSAATGLPVVAQLGDLSQMDERARETWAFQTLGLLQARLGCGSTGALICGFTSSRPGEGRSTWMKLLADAAHRQGYCVLTLSAESSGQTHAAPPTHQPEPLQLIPTPAPASREHLSLTDQFFNPQFRDQLSQGINSWSKLANVALFVEVPPFSTPAGVLLAAQVPNLFWVCREGLADADETGEQVRVLHQTHPRLAGALLNALPKPKITRGLSAASLLGWALLNLALTAQAQSPNTIVSPVPPPAPAQTNVAPNAVVSNAVPVAGRTNGVLSILAPENLAPWQQHLTLGAGDVLSLSIYGLPETAQFGMTIGPDGRLNYLQATDIMAAGLTVDELRATLEKALAKYYLAPQVLINPLAYRSKKYYLLGSVLQKGVYVLDRPLTVIEAIARGRGFYTTVLRQNVSMMVDLTRSFLMRKAVDGTFARVPVDFEALFLRGDLSQNIALAPEDYLFFPENGPQEVYVLGEVRAPGIVPYAPDLTALGAVAARGGFTTEAWRARILVVRGSLAKPHGLVVNAGEILRARGRDMRLANRDIIYVHKKPWSKPEELLELAIGAFGNAAVLGWTGLHVGPFITHPIF